MKVGLVPDTHGLVRPSMLAELERCAVDLHSGDIGGQHVLDAIGEVAPVSAIRGTSTNRPICVRRGGTTGSRMGHFDPDDPRPGAGRRPHPHGPRSSTHRRGRRRCRRGRPLSQTASRMGRDTAAREPRKRRATSVLASDLGGTDGNELPDHEAS